MAAAVLPVLPRCEHHSKMKEAVRLKQMREEWERRAAGWLAGLIP
jgi:hypothetical protein